jgi:hypothetical protein
MDMDSRMVGLIGGISGAAIGILGGMVGTYFSVRNTEGPRERAFMIRSSAVCWIAVTAFLAAMWFTPIGYRILLWLPYLLILPMGIRYGNRRQQQIREEETKAAAFHKGA